MQRRTRCISLSAATSYQGYLILVAAPGKFTGFKGLEDEKAPAILKALKPWLVKMQALGRVHHVQLIHTDAATAFLSDEFISGCAQMGIHVEAAAPKHQEQNGLVEWRWQELNSMAKAMCNHARLGSAFYYHSQ
jgi:hypothetical protein